MSFFKKLFGGASFADERADADRLFDAGRFADARMAYVRALDAKKDAIQSAVEHCEARVGLCLDQMAELRIEEAERLEDAGDIDLAEEELRHAMELASSDAIRKKARRKIETLEKEDAKRQAELPEEMSDEDRWALLAGNWEDDQVEEYDEYGDPFRDALLALHEEQVEEALAALEEIAEEAEEPLYLWLEIGRARALSEDFEGAEEALREFLSGLEEDQGGEARLAAHASLAGLRDREEDEEGAIAEYEAAIEAFPDDLRPFLLLGRYLRAKGHAEEAAEVLEAALPLLDEDRPDWRFLEELGLALSDAGKSEHAGEILDQVLGIFVSVRRHGQPIEYSPAAAIARAKLYEDEGRHEKAADLYRSLADGSDKANHLLYHREAARLLLELELDEEARRMLTRALALAEDDDEVRAEIEAQLEKLE